MKKRIILGLVLLFALYSVQAQERRLVTINGDTINAPRRPVRPRHPWVIGIQGGGSYLTGSTANLENNLQNDIGVSKENAKDFYNQMRTGFNLGASAHFLFRHSWGLGLKYLFFKTSAGTTFPASGISNPSEMFTVGMKEWQYVNSEGPSLLFRQWLDPQRKFSIEGEFSPLLVQYRDEIRYDRNQFVLQRPSTLRKGTNWGANFALSCEYYLQPRWSIGVNVGYFYSEIRKVTLSSVGGTSQTIRLAPKDYVDISRLDYFLSVRYHF